MRKSVIPKHKLIPEKLFNQIQRSMPIATVDMAIVRTNSETKLLEILLIKRKIYPEINKWCLIGGRILKGERFKDAIDRQIEREFQTKARIVRPWSYDKPLAVINDPVVDPQKHFVCMLYPAILKSTIKVSSGPEWSEAKWFPAHKLPSPLGFNHKKEIGLVLKVLRKER